MRTALLLTLALTLPLQAEWFRGNTHTHTSESDGDSAPLEVAQWYAEHGYHFLVITDHDRITTIEHPPLLLIPGEEVTASLPKKPVHVNAIGLGRAVPPQKGATVAETLQKNVAAVRDAGAIATINHPNFGWSFGSAEMLETEGATLLEIASGHPYVNVYGPPSVEQMWDDLLTAGRRIFAVATDDAHHFRKLGEPFGSHPGKGWIVVRAAELEAKAILDAISRGDFYASTGVSIADYAVDGETLTVSIEARNGARYRTEFIGPHGRVLGTSTDVRSSFALPEGVAYVRAKVIDSNGRAAWMQPLFRTPAKSAP
jgi:hypothetical protein